MSERIHNDAAAMLLYLAGELPSEERAAMDRRLETDPALAAELDALRGVDAAMRRLGAGDAPERPAVRDAAVARLGRSMRRRLAEQAAGPAADFSADPRGGRGWWIYASGVAAVVLVGFLGWWAWTPLKVGSTTPFNAVASNRPPSPPPVGGYAPFNDAMERQRMLDQIAADPLARVLSLDGEPSPLSEAEDELGDLAALQNGNDGVDVFLGLSDELPTRDDIQ